ncbi:non-LTR retroelement reverse transcriptase [Artemisia annua]|uniref:Non-LTR retroelement reverse transcriptase n=1 Tax=Artemisia annua TaxID=35608 RepID=A0A2U1PYC1_ARTAN|nr:non-LTR retroelement reverse transcriptase [Artemisia annua]
MQNALVRDNLKNQSTHKEKTEVLIRWVAPPVNWVLLNTDGASRGNPGEAGGGGILQDSQGCFLRAFTENHGICTVTRSEILALLRGIVMARDVGIRKLIIKLDSEVVVRLMEGETIHHSPAFYSVQTCRDLLRSSGWEVKLEHCYRESNIAADWLANHGCEQEERLCMFDSPPPELGSIILEDVKGVAWPRVVCS